ncbi:IS3 family transposase [Schaalia turicensis]|nr:IS3 family transposase [Schaalia turicensis]
MPAGLLDAPPYVSVDELYRAVDDYIFWYNNTRLQNDSRA